MIQNANQNQHLNPNNMPNPVYKAMYNVHKPFTVGHTNDHKSLRLNDEITSSREKFRHDPSSFFMKKSIFLKQYRRSNINKPSINMSNTTFFLSKESREQRANQ